VMMMYSRIKLDLEDVRLHDGLAHPCLFWCLASVAPVAWAGT